MTRIRDNMTTAFAVAGMFIISRSRLGEWILQDKRVVEKSSWQNL